MSDEVIQDYIILGISPDVDLAKPEYREALERLALKQVAMQYAKPPRMLLIVSLQWCLTSDPDEVERFQPADGCAACLAGNDQAQALLKEHPERRLALGNISYIEVW